MAKFKKIVLVHKEGLEKITAQLIKDINGWEVDILVASTEHKDLKKESLEGVDLVITLGGDGTFIEAANLIEDSFILGINSSPSSSEGALTSIDINEVHCLKEILAGKFNLRLRQRAEVKLNGERLNGYATNEVYIGAKSQFHSSRYVIRYKELEEEQRSSGVIISTGTGSAAWHKSAGGTEFSSEERKLSFIVREPYPGKRVYIPHVLRGDILEGEKLVIESKRDFGGIIAIGFKTYEFNKGRVVEVRLSKKPLKVLSK